ncbi:MAG: hypothetical protein H0V16_09020 [Burkholderiaceae bacterium]|nr:hypothetical protein [Burkholderiaceae bacterium]
MKFRYLFQLAAAALLVAPATAHHGWSSFDQDRPLYLGGTLTQVKWQNPHAEIMLRVDVTQMPERLASRALPAQQQSVDAAGILKKVQVPSNGQGTWEVELAPLSRMQAWGLSQPLKVGERVEVIGYRLTDENKRVVRVEYLFVGDKAYAFRSAPVN